MFKLFLIICSGMICAASTSTLETLPNLQRHPMDSSFWACKQHGTKFTMRNYASGRCLSVADDESDNLQIYPCLSDEDRFNWLALTSYTVFQSKVILQNVHSGKCLAIDSQGMVSQATCDDNSLDQAWGQGIPQNQWGNYWQIVQGRDDNCLAYTTLLEDPVNVQIIIVKCFHVLTDEYQWWQFNNGSCTM